jgi:hypothetical protein
MSRKPENKGVCIEVHDSGHGLQLSIGDNDTGYRLHGPKFAGNSKRVLAHLLTISDCEVIEGYLKQVREAHHD